MREIKCDKCGTTLAILRDAKVRKDMVAYCAPCDRPRKEPSSTEIPDFMRGLFAHKS